MNVRPNATLVTYVEQEILPRYTMFDAAHQENHVRTVIAQSLNLAQIINESAKYMNADGTKTIINIDMAYAIAAYHDTGLVEGRDTHHIASARIIRADTKLLQWFTKEQIEIMADAAEDHRASAKSAPRTIYGRIVAEADRDINPINIIRRTMQYGFAHYPELDKEGHYERTLEHLHEKYAEGGYLKLWIPESPNGKRLAELREIIRNEALLRQIFEQIYISLSNPS
ncbi:MAG: HD domain-containing protein [Bacteroidales bacterium]|nr:HD domain-containing protein [Bacteroidales bacterium]